MYFKLVRTLLNYHVLGTSTATISFSLCTHIPRMNVMLDFISNPTMGKHFLFSILSLSTHSWQIDWPNTN